MALPGPGRPVGQRPSVRRRPPIVNALRGIKFPPAPRKALNEQLGGGTPLPFMQDIIKADPMYQQELADLFANETADRASTMGALRSALVRFGGAGALQNILTKLGGQTGWEDLLDQVTLGGAQAADTSGTSLWSQLEKQHGQRNLTIRDQLAASGILSSGQTGYELGEERQRDVIARDQAIGQLLDYLRGGTGGFAQRQGERGRQRADALTSAGQRVSDLGLGGQAPPPLKMALPENLANALRNAVRKGKKYNPRVQ